mgnify:CR=1 FL=1
MFFWGPITGPGVIKKNRLLLFNRRFNFFFHWPWTWWVPGSRSIKDPHLKLLKTRMQSLKRGWSRSGWWPCKKRFTILRRRGVFSWQGPFNGCHYLKSGQSACMFCISHGIQCRQDRRYINSYQPAYMMPITFWLMGHIAKINRLSQNQPTTICCGRLFSSWDRD